LSGTFHDANGTPAFGVSIIINCTRFAVRGDASLAEDGFGRFSANGLFC
jgi:hypothetical protein